MKITALAISLCCSLFLALFVLACGGAAEPLGPEADAARSREELTALVSRAGTDELKAAVGAYERALEEQRERRERAIVEVQGLTGGEILGPAGLRLKQERDEIEGALRRLAFDLALYTSELERRQGAAPGAR